MTTVKNIPAILKAIQDGAAPPSFSQKHLTSIGYKSTNDRGIIPVLKDLKFLSDDGKPTPRYHSYRDKSQAKAVLGQAIKEAYEDLFHINERPSDTDKAAIEGKFKATHNVNDNIAELQARTFFALLKLADLDGTPPEAAKPAAGKKELGALGEEPHAPQKFKGGHSASTVGLRYNIEVHLPATKDSEVYNAIFKSLKEHLLDD
jgi:hypothetical protein